MSLEQRTTTFPGLISDHDVLYETQMLGTMISAILYGIVIMLSADCLILLLKRDAAVESRRLQRFLVFFVVSLFLLSTLSLIQGMLISATSIFRGHSFPSLPGGTPFALPFSIWISDGFMLWRCATLYQGITPLSRRILLLFISLVWLAAFGSGLSLFFKPSKMRLPALLIISFSTILNVVICTMIIARLVFHKIYLRKVLGPGHGSLYTKIIAMTVESAALLILVGIPCMFLVAYQNSNGSMMLLSLLHQICSISPMLIVLRVARGRASVEMPSTARDDRRRTWQKRTEAIESLHFDSRTSTMSNNSEAPERSGEMDF
ncbi:hypothetical protein CVT26_010266 [Gymnopilus dilepis]|uniref:G-protein coupled receptors family 1 profile domain-containing protein n=1 Tax=Gymnopilus dilepis TaxID=231916 RepID=A0A409Y102_9AGAR|nr:hypothetical protein CVT26_010266 [Gymnopilus dilepis]